jgi:poly(3-hydroxybutyrate) depolymerase
MDHTVAILIGLFLICTVAASTILRGALHRLSDEDKRRLSAVTASRRIAMLAVPLLLALAYTLVVFNRSDLLIPATVTALGLLLVQTIVSSIVLARSMAAAGLPSNFLRDLRRVRLIRICGAAVLFGGIVVWLIRGGLPLHSGAEGTAVSESPRSVGGIDSSAEPIDPQRIERALVNAGGNRGEIESALRTVPMAQRRTLEWLVSNMPDSDLRTLRGDFLLQHCDAAWNAWQSAPWAAEVSEDLFLDCILPYASITEPREAWFASMRARCQPMIAGAQSPGEAAVRINQQLFSAIGVQYSTKRQRADQSPSESIESGMASCTGLAILLIDACRSVGIPARFAGTPMWRDRSGNHSWVEVWDGGWHFTGAAEPTGDRLDDGWFRERVADCRGDEPLHAVYAVTWTDSPVHFPIGWREGAAEIIRAFNVTARYMPPDKPSAQGLVRVRICALDGEQRVAVKVSLRSADGATLFEGTTRDETHDANDHLTTTVPAGAACELHSDAFLPMAFTVQTDGQLLTARVERSASRQALEDLRRWIAAERNDRPIATSVVEQAFAAIALSKADAATARELLWNAVASQSRAAREQELATGIIEAGGARMPIWFKAFGTAPTGGHSLFLSMHGGGGAPREVNDQQWKNQQRLYQPAEGIYVAPRAPGDTWDLWHQSQIDPLLSRLIEDMVIARGVNADRVYLMGYSAGGDGVFQLAPRMADRFAAAAMMAGHPNETRPDGLRNLPFTLHMGAQDAAFNRNVVAADWARMLTALAAADVGGYPHLVEIHEGKGHWMDREDASALGWMAQFNRAVLPKRIVWLQDDVVHKRYYWLAVDSPRERSRIVAECDGQEIRIVEAPDDCQIRVRLDDRLVDLDRPVRILRGGEEMVNAPLPRTIGTMARMLAERADPAAALTAEAVLQPAR